MHFKIVGRITNVDTIASGTAIPRAQATLESILKGVAQVEFSDGTIRQAEIHWYEAHGIGAKEYKIKRVVE